MTKKNQRSRSMRRVFVKTPGKRNILHFRKRKPSKAKCSDCFKVLKGIKNERPYKTKNLSKTKKSVSRPFGGNLCSRCMRKILLKKARN